MPLQQGFAASRRGSRRRQPAFFASSLLVILFAVGLGDASVARANDDPHFPASKRSVSFDLFYGTLTGGDWYSTPDFGYVWQPPAAAADQNWRPYTDGTWVQTDDGWTWVANENFGWATYHYGRWTRLAKIGWVWEPGYDWGPGWVSWRMGGDYIGWAPLPPKPERKRKNPRPSIEYADVEVESGYNAATDVRYDIGPGSYNFVPARQFDAPNLRDVLLPPAQSLAAMGATNNVTRVVYRRAPDRLVIENDAPAFEAVREHVERPIQRLKLLHHDDVAYLREKLKDGENPDVVHEGTLQVASPTIMGREINFAMVRPPVLKQEVADEDINNGWQLVGVPEAELNRVRADVRRQALAADATLEAELSRPAVQESADTPPPTPMPMPKKKDKDDD